MRLTSYETFCLYIALKNHFSKESYDYFKYQGKTNISRESFLNRKDKFQFQKLCRLYAPEEMIDFLVANFLNDEKIWVGDLLHDEAKDIYLEYMKRKQSLSYRFENELDLLINSAPNGLNGLFKLNQDGQLPVVAGYYWQIAGIETLALLDYFVGYFDKYNDQLKDDFLWSKLRMKCKKLLPFMVFDKNKIKDILKNRVDAHI